MLADGDLPKVGPDRKSLGVSVAGSGDDPDVHPDEAQIVHPNGEGMSVVSEWRKLPPRLIPQRLRRLARDARGEDSRRIWRRGSGEFVTGSFGADLQFRRDNSRHGTVGPDKAMHIEAFQLALASTRATWVVDEE
jgi:hypothetical protein